MRILVTGATSPVGGALVHSLIASPDVELVLAVGGEPRSPIPSTPRLVYRAADLAHPRVVHDLLWADGRAHAIEVVVHCPDHRRIAERGHRAHAQNVDATRELMLGCARHPTIRRFVYRSVGDVYAVEQSTPNLIDEESPLDFEHHEQWLRDRVEADLAVCSHAGPPPSICVLRCAEILAPETGSQLFDYLQSRVCLRPLGFDPMVNVLSLDDAVAAFGLAARSSATGVFNIPGLDTLPLSRLIELWGRAQIPIPGPLLSPLYGLRRRATGFELRYSMYAGRLHFGNVLDGRRAGAELGYVPRTPVTWPEPWWRVLLRRLAVDRAAPGLDEPNIGRVGAPPPHVRRPR